ncbi:MAG: (Fe-S)-binding protein [Burkholderiaceae bacterium]
MLSEVRSNIASCLKCGACRLDWKTSEPICPSGMQFGFDSHYAIGRVSLARAALADSAVLTGDAMRTVLSCTSCGACDIQCNPAVGVEPLRVIEALKQEGFRAGALPPELRDFLKSVSVYGNPYRLPQEERGQWADGMSIEKYAGHDYLYYVGDVGSYDERGIKLARNVAKLLRMAGVSFGILAEEERSDGNEVEKVGEQELFEYLAQQNIEQFRAFGVKRIVTLCPHAFNAMKVTYRRFGAEFEVLHYTQLLTQLLREEKLVPKKAMPVPLTYHDPCFLGRHNGEFDSPREVLDAIPGVKRIEMERSGENGMCCGGGGGNFFTGLVGLGPRSPGRNRIREAQGSGARILAVACPNCNNMLEDASRSEDLSDQITVRDVAGLLLEAMALDVEVV